MMISTYWNAFARTVNTVFKSSKGRAVSTLVAVVVTALILGLMVYREREVLFAQKWSINWAAVLAAFFFYSLCLYLAVKPWTWIVEAMGVKVKFWDHFRYYCISQLARRLPGTVWYVAYRSQMYQKEGLPVQLTTLASGVELALSIISGILLSVLFAVPLLKQYQAGVFGIGALLILCLGFLHPRVIGWILKKFGSSIERFEYKKILLWVLVMVLMRLCSGILVFAIVNIIYPLPLANLMYIIGGWAFIGVLANILIFSPTNLGFTEVSLSLVLSSIMPSSIAVLAAVLSRLSITLFEFTWAIVGLLVEKASRKAG
jgi:glycosyltransferase 2 family protein